MQESFLVQLEFCHLFQQQSGVWLWQSVNKKERIVLRSPLHWFSLLLYVLNFPMPFLFYETIGLRIS
jgi:hypothetical protein